MHALGVRIGKQCKAGDFILLNGPLGAGKTVLVQGIGEALGISDVTSPTFVIARIHKGPLPLIHVDAYRLLEGGNAAAFLDDLGINLKPAAAMGMRTIKVGDPTIALSELSDHLSLQF